MSKFLKAEKYMNKNEITLVGTFSRKMMVKIWFKALREMDLPREKIHLIIFNNKGSSLLREAIEHELVCLETSNEPQFKSILHHESNRRGGLTIKGEDNDDFEKSKLQPIWEMWKDLTKMIKTEAFFLIEDDTIAPKHAFWKLLDDLISVENCGFAIGISTGRATYKWMNVRLGVHSLFREGNKILKRISLDPNLKGIQEIDCSGVYCYTAWTKAWTSGFEGMDEYVADVPFFGMDNILTNNIKLKGWKLIADFDVWVNHMQMSGAHMITFNKKQAVQMAELWIDEFNNYAQGILIKNDTHK